MVNRIFVDITTGYVIIAESLSDIRFLRLYPKRYIETKNVKVAELLFGK